MIARFQIILTVLFICVTNLGNAEPLWVIDGFKKPESVTYDRFDRAFYVSNIDGNEAAKDGQGGITKISQDGRIVEHNWLSGINAPKGLATTKTQVFAADVGELLVIDKQTQSVVKRFPTDAKFLNDVVVTPSGEIYASDNVGHAIYKLQGNTLVKWFSHEKMHSPNGLYFREGKLYTAGKDTLFEIDLNTAKTVKVYSHPVGDVVDGLIALGDERFLMSDWFGRVWLYHETGSKVVLNTVEEKVNASDMTYVEELQLLVIPTFLDNRVMAHKLNF